MTSLSLDLPRTLHPARNVVAAVVGATGIGVLLACGLTITLAAGVDPTYLVPSGRRTGYPAWMRGPLAGHANPLHMHVFIVLMAAMVAAWIVVIVCARSLPAWAVVTGIGAGVVVFTLSPPLLSTDVFNYIAYGQMGQSGIDPYLFGPALLAGQPVYGFTGHLWKDVPSAYGPLFTLGTYPLASLGVAGAFWALKAVSALSVLALAGFSWLSAPHLGRDPRVAAAFVALNPLVLVYALGGAHNDLIVAALLAAAVWLAVSGRAAGAGGTVVAAIAVKLSAGLALPFVLLGARPRWRTIIGAASAAIVAVAVGYVVFGSAMKHMTDALALQQHFHWIVVSVPRFIGHYAGWGMPRAGARHVIDAVAVGACIALLVWAWRRDRWIEAAAGATLIALATASWVLPWYIVWALPFAALARGRVIPAAAIALTVVLMAMQLDHFLLTHASHHHHRTAAVTRTHREHARRGHCLSAGFRCARSSSGRAAARHTGRAVPVRQGCGAASGRCA
jgi:alpha-1,6-mannosyltransferase